MQERTEPRAGRVGDAVRLDGEPLPGLQHACAYCFARGTHEYLDLDAGRDFDSQIVVKINVADVLAKELRRGTWQRDPVMLGTNTDPYQRAEGRYRLMPGIVGR